MTRAWVGAWAGGAALAAGLMAGAVAEARSLIPGVRDRGTLRIGVAEGPPYQYTDPMSGRYVGLNIDLAEEVAEILGVEPEVVPATWATLVTGPEVAQCDVIFANLFAIPQRAVSVAFTDAYDTYDFHVMVAADSAIESLEDLDDPGVSFAGVAGTVEASHPRELFPEAIVNEPVTDQANAGATSVLSGQSDAVFVDPGLWRILTTQNPSIAGRARLVNGEDALLKPVSLSCAVRHRDHDMLNFRNVFIRDRVANGAIAEARDEWFDRIADQ